MSSWRSKTRHMSLSAALAFATEEDAQLTRLLPSEGWEKVPNGDEGRSPLRAVFARQAQLYLIRSGVTTTEHPPCRDSRQYKSDWPWF